MPTEVEEVITTHPSIAACVAPGVPSNLGEFDVKVCGILKPGRTFEAQALKDWCGPRMARFQVPEHVESLTDILRTPTGKPALARLHIIEDCNPSVR